MSRFPKDCWDKSVDNVTIEVEAIPAPIGTSCQICDSFIPIISARDGYPRICDECKKRLKKLLYGSPKEGEE